MATENEYRLTALPAGQTADVKAPTINFEHRLGRVRRVDRDAFLIERARGKKVLHLGCADEHVVVEKLMNQAHLHAKLASVAKELWGLDNSEKGISELRQAGFDHLIRGDVERLDEIDELRNQHFDVIIAGELIEHIYNPGLFLKACRSLCAADTELILTTPNALVYSQTIFALLDREAIHPDHTLMWSPTTMRTLLARTGFAIKEFTVYGNGPCVQLHGKQEPIVKKLSRVALRSLDFIVRNAVVRFRPWLNNGLIVVATAK
jgi:2-polyprenyl-3-methyl-5-hydroxy-6-metoxy-1,4-benzoquinol methylase